MTKQRFIKPILLTFVLSLLFSFVSCSKGSDVRKYKEDAAPVSPHGNSAQGMPPSPHGMGMGDQPAAPVHFKWDAPQGWTEDKTASSMRLATFKITSNGKEAECTMIPLQGDAGGLEANISRWMEQLRSVGTQFPADVTEKKLLEKAEKFTNKGNLPTVIVDFTTVTSKPTDKSFLVSVVSVQGSSVFIKFMGEKSQLIENKDKFKALCQSFRFTSPEGK